MNWGNDIGLSLIYACVLIVFGGIVGNCVATSDFEYGCKARCEKSEQIYHSMEDDTGCLCTDQVSGPSRKKI